MEVWRRDMTAVSLSKLPNFYNKMTDLIKEGQTMTSLQIAEIAGKRHCEVLRAIRNMEPAWEKSTLRKFAYKLKITEIGNGALRETPYYELTKTECLYIATKFNDEARARIILRWEELEIERLRQTVKPTESETLPPPIDKTQYIKDLVESVDGKYVTTSRKIAGLLGRKHSSILDTINANRYQRWFKYGNFTRRAYTEGQFGHGSEYLITRTGLAGLTSIMRSGAREKIKEAYDGAWSLTCKELPAALPPAPDDSRGTAGNDTVRELAKWIDELRAEVRALKNTLETYTELYEKEKELRKKCAEATGYWKDMYSDLLWRVTEIDEDFDLQEALKGHSAFRKRATKA